jgi:hypothetical protein
MKKTYINPEMEVVEMKVQQMLAASSIGITEGNIDAGDVGAPEFEFMPEAMPGMPSFIFQ